MLERLALVDLAGLATESEIEPAMGDFQKALGRCRRMAMDSAADTMTPVELEIETAVRFWQLGVKASALVDEHAELIDAVASALLEHGELDGEAIDKVIRGEDVAAR